MCPVSHPAVKATTWFSGEHRKEVLTYPQFQSAVEVASEASDLIQQMLAVLEKID